MATATDPAHARLVRASARALAPPAHLLRLRLFICPLLLQSNLWAAPALSSACLSIHPSFLVKWVQRRNRGGKKTAFLMRIMHLKTADNQPVTLRASPTFFNIYIYKYLKTAQNVKVIIIIIIYSRDSWFLRLFWLHPLVAGSSKKANTFCLRNFRSGNHKDDSS